jgi:1-acyl-sn-glycerol-3-phosphate acyltransferase
VRNTAVTLVIERFNVNRMQPSSGHPLQFQGSVLAQRLLRWAGWQVRFEGFPGLQGVVVGYPHTSNWDFILMVIVKWATGLQVSFLAKDSLFRFPVFSAWLRWLGGVAIDRTAPNGVVGQLVALMREHQAQQLPLWLGVAPEGTRRLTPGWKSGFYQLALQTGVPLCLLRIDWGAKTVDLSQTLMLTGKLEHDYQRLAQGFAGVQGFHPQQAAPIRPLPANPSVPVGDRVS